MAARTAYEKEMFFVHGKNVGKLVIQQGPAPVPAGK
jgi:hypothetical protein